MAAPAVPFYNKGTKPEDAAGRGKAGLRLSGGAAAARAGGLRQAHAPFPKGFHAVSYTHLDVYKRQGVSFF